MRGESDRYREGEGPRLNWRRGGIWTLPEPFLRIPAYQGQGAVCAERALLHCSRDRSPVDQAPKPEQVRRGYPCQLLNSQE